MSIPETIGRYRVLRELGRGGMGVVFAARDESLGRDIAIKMLHRGAEPHERDRLRREARAAAAIAHAAICQLYEIGEAGGDAKSPADRYGSASAMLADLRALSSADWSSQSAPIVRAMTRLIVPRFGLLR